MKESWDPMNDESDDSMERIVEKLRITFKEEAYELLAGLEAALLELENSPTDSELINRAFRALHTIKGSSGMCEFHDIASFAHEIETYFDLVRKGEIAVTKEIIDLTMMAGDQLTSLFDVFYRGGKADTERTEQIVELFKKQTAGKEGPRASDGPRFASQQEIQPAQPDGRKTTYRIRFRPAANSFVRGTDPLAPLEELRRLGRCCVVAHTEAIPDLEELRPDVCYTYWDVLLTSDRGVGAIEDVFEFVRDESDLKIENIDEEGRLEDEGAYKNLGDILLERGDLTEKDLQEVLRDKKRVGEMLVEKGLVSSDKVETALAEQQFMRELREQRQGADAASSIRVATGKLDSLVNLVGELVTVQARLSQTAQTLGNSALQSIAEEVERLTADLRDNTMSIRMLPIGTTFSKFKRVVRDLSAELGKEIDLTTGGAETELDKTVIEKLGDPLVHIIRNSIDHGIERPDVRTAAGKPRKGTIHLSALHSGAHVLIRVQDDGAGLDAETIRAKAVERGLLKADAEITEQELWQFILAPGFSTAKQVTGVSGRGVGMDVVKKAIDAIRGTLEISSEKGVGTTITLKLPLTLAIIDGFITKVGADSYIFPLSLVEECVELTRDSAFSKGGRDLINVRGHIVPFIRLREQFAIRGEAPQIEQIVITNVDGRRVGLVVDTVVGEHQTVLKSLGKFYRDVEGISGATILGDGTVALILDIPKLISMAEQLGEACVPGRTAQENIEL